MKIKSPFYKEEICQIHDFLDKEELKRCYLDGSGLGIDLIECIEDKVIVCYTCPITKYNFFHPYDIEGTENYYKELESRNKYYYNSNNWEFKKVLSLINDCHISLLEIGSGNLSFLKLVKNKINKAVGLELNQNSVKSAKKYGIDVFHNSIEEYSLTNPNKFDLVCAFQVLEHISDVDSFLKSSLKCLKKNGRLIFAVPNNDSIFFNKRKLLNQYSSEENYKLHCTTIALNSPPHHMGLWDLKSLKSLVNIYPIKIRSVHFEPLNKFRYGLVRDILISRLSKYFGYSLSKFIASNFFSNKFLKKYFKGDSILIEFEKIN